MRTEGWLYGLAFAGVLAGGALLVRARLAPRERPPRPSSAASPGRPAPPLAPEGPDAARAAGSAAPARPAPAVRRLHVVVEGEGGALRGALRPPVGARLVASEPAAAGGLSLTLEAHAGEVAFGAVGHRWVRRAVDGLDDGSPVRLPAAAPSVVVKVRETDGGPAEDVPVEVRPASPAGPRRTDAGGTVVLDDLAEGLTLVLVGGTERAAPPLRVVAGVDREARAVLEPAWTVTGRVLGPDGAAVAGARIAGLSARGPLGRASATGADGRLRWRGPVSSVLVLEVAAPGLAPVAFEASPPATGPLLTDLGALRLEEAEVRVVGRVKGLAPGASAEVRAEPRVAALLRELFGAESAAGSVRRAPVRDDGTYELAGLAGGVPLRLSLRGDCLPEDALVEPRAGDQLVRDFEPAPGERLELEVHDEVLGGPAVGLSVLASAEPREGDAEQPGDRRGVTGPGGRLTLPGLAPGAVYLRAYREGRRSLLRRVELPAEGPVQLGLTPALEDAGRRVVGEVVDAAGAPLPGVSVRAAGVHALTDAQGRFRLEGVESLAPLVEVVAAYEPGARPGGAGDARALGLVARAVVAPGGPPLTLALGGTQTLAATLLDGLTDEPLSAAWIVVRTDDGRVLLDRGLATDQGRVLLPGLPRQPLLLALLAPGRRLERAVPVEALSAGAAPGGDLRELGALRLHRGLAVSGHVRDARALPVAGARVAALDPGWLAGLARDPSPRRELLLRSTQTAEDGAYRLEGLDPRRPAVLVAWAPGHAPTVRRAAPRAAGPGPAPGPLELSADVRLRRGSRLSLLLSDASSREPVRGAVLDLEHARNGSDWLDLVLRGVLGGQCGSSADWAAASAHLLFEGSEPGVYEVGPVEPGEYELLVEHPLFRAERRRLPVLDPSDPLAYEAFGLDEGRRLLPGPEMVSVYGSDRMRLPLDLTPLGPAPLPGEPSGVNPR